MEQSLDDIAEGKAEYLAVIIAAHAQLEQELATVTKARQSLSSAASRWCIG